jgi:glycosyltransferase involved in cell wall biosynthesis
MKKMLMFVYNDLNNDARVQRAAESVSDIIDLEVLSIGKEYSNAKYKTINIKSSVASNILKYFDVFLKIISWLKGKKYDVVYAHDFSAALPALFMKVFKKCDKMIYDAHELFIPEDGVSFSARDRFFYWLEKELIKRADLIICAQEKRGELMVNHFKLKTKPVTIRNISKLPQTTVQLESSLQKKCDVFFMKKGITIVYAGALATDRKLDELVSDVAELGEGYKLLFVGNGSDSERLQNIAKEYTNLTCCFLGNIPYAHLSNVLNRCDIGYLCYPVDKLNNIYCASNKVYEYASINLPIVANDNPTVKEIFDKWLIGICSDDFQSAIRTIVADFDNFKEGSIKFNSENSWEDEAEILRNEVKTVLKYKEKANEI